MVNSQRRSVSYTEVLYKLSPGRVCTLRNRSMALLQCGHAELAVMDAYHASIAAVGLRKVGPAVASLLIPDLNMRYENRIILLIANTEVFLEHSSR